MSTGKHSCDRACEPDRKADHKQSQVKYSRWINYSITLPSTTYFLILHSGSILSHRYWGGESNLRTVAALPDYHANEQFLHTMIHHHRGQLILSVFPFTDTSWVLSINFTYVSGTMSPTPVSRRLGK